MSGNHLSRTLPQPANAMILEFGLDLGIVQGLMPGIRYLVPVRTAVEQEKAVTVRGAANRQTGNRPNFPSTNTMHGIAGPLSGRTNDGPGNDCRVVDFGRTRTHRSSGSNDKLIGPVGAL